LIKVLLQIVGVEAAAVLKEETAVDLEAVEAAVEMDVNVVPTVSAVESKFAEHVAARTQLQTLDKQKHSKLT